ncbi:DUF4760 domain-containing protein [Methyloceanibacter sp.]|uniref:DUF4760 domain-containing protein n=1 Tax=Methyloceanibacter sp. TaxID=1965321 RepID=UPI003D6C96CD
MDQTGVTLTVGGVAALIAIWGVVTQRAIARRRATLDHIARCESDGDLIYAQKKFVELATAPGGLGPWAEVTSGEEVQCIRLVLNELELVAIGIQRGIIDYELYKRWKRSGVIRSWNFAAPFITRLRDKLKNEAIYQEFEQMVWWMRGTQPPRRRRWLSYWF